MQMQHIYQPVMLIELLKNGGQALEEDVARGFVNLDPTQQKYYEDNVHNMAVKILKSNGQTAHEAELLIVHAVQLRAFKNL
jgi:ATP adenylyltransferase